MEIRTIRPDEAEDYLRLLCSVFNLDLERARGVYYSEPMYDLQRKWALLENNEIISICSTSPLTFGWGRGYGIAGVATRPEFRRRGLARTLLDHVHRHSLSIGETAAYLFAKNPSLYRDCGFEIVDETIHGPIKAEPGRFQNRSLSFHEVQAIYDRWAEGSPARLRRDAVRWDLWQWNLKASSAHNEGYLCIEGGMSREALFVEDLAGGWPIQTGIEWHGLRSVTEMLQIPVAHPLMSLHFMAKGSPDRPQMFLTDQF